MSKSDEILRTLAFQRAVLTLILERGAHETNIEEAIEHIDSLIELIGCTASR